MRFLTLCFIVAGLLLGQPALAADRRVVIRNVTGNTIMEFYGSNVDAEDWEEDILGSDVLPSGSSVSIDFDDGTGSCLFDFLAVFGDGDEMVERDVNVCAITTFTFE